MKELKRGLNREQFRAAVLRERACEFGFEEVRYFDLIRWRMDEKFSTPLHGLHVYKNKNDQSIYVKSSLCWEPKVAVIGGNPETIHVNGI